MLTIAPDLVEMDRIDDKIWFARAAKDATAQYGNDELELAADDVEISLFGKK